MVVHGEAVVVDVLVVAGSTICVLQHLVPPLIQGTSGAQAHAIDTKETLALRWKGNRNRHGICVALAYFSRSA
jgi:hypothetical protein